MEASLQAKKLLCFFRQEKLPILHIQHISIRQGATFFPSWLSKRDYASLD
jgi:hypothetical protein